MLTTDALVKRACLAAIVGLISAEWLSARWAALLAVVVLYVLLLIRAQARVQWPSP